MTMTARMVVLMDPEEKRAIESRARSHRLTPSEWVRQAAREYDPVPDEEVLTLFAEEIERSVARMRQKQDDSIAHSEACTAEIRAIRAARLATQQ